MDGVERSQFSRHRLSGTVEDEGVHVYQFERTTEGENRGSALREIRVVERRTDPKAIERPQAFGDDERAGDTAADSRPLRQRVALSQGKPEQDRRVDVRDHR